MRKLVFVAVLALVGALLTNPGSGPANADTLRPDLQVARGWNDLALAAVKATRATDSDAARLYAMVNVAMYDAVNGVVLFPVRGHALIPGPGPFGADPEAAAAAAAHDVLVRVDAPRAVTYDERLAADLARLKPGARRDAGVSWGRQVGRRVVEARTGDGSTPSEDQRPGTGAGKFPFSWSGVQYRNVTPFAVADAGAHVLGPPPALSTLDYAAGYAEVALLGDARIAAADKLKTFQFWSLPRGSVQPPGAWLRVALTTAEARGVRLHDGTRLLALLTMTLVDTAIATVGTKFAHQHWRPETAIPQAQFDDGNVYTDADSTWMPRGGGSGSPEWVSGHSTFSGAGAAVLAGFFCADSIPFELLATESVGPRTYPSFSAAAAEAGRSRVFGGLHFEFSNQAGLALGRGVAAEVLRSKLLLPGGLTHHGDCPL